MGTTRKIGRGRGKGIHHLDIRLSLLKGAHREKRPPKPAREYPVAPDQSSPEKPVDVPIEAPLATVTDYDGLIVALIARMKQLGLTVQLIDELALLPDGNAGKIFGPARVKNLGPKSLGGMLDVMCAKMILVSDPAALERLEIRRKRLIDDGKRVRPVVATVRTASLGKIQMKRVTPAVMREMQVRSRDTYRHVTKASTRRRVARTAARARWKWQRLKRKVKA